MGQITELLSRVNGGDKVARDALFALAYGELKKLAHVRLYQGGRSEMLDTTALVHEAYIRFIQSSELRSEDRRSFFAFASQVMRNVIVDTARARLAQRRGGGAPELTLSTQLLEHLSSGEEAILDVHEALLLLEQAEPRLAQLVEMRYYGGYTEAETTRRSARSPKRWESRNARCSAIGTRRAFCLRPRCSAPEPAASDQTKRFPGTRVVFRTRFASLTVNEQSASRRWLSVLRNSERSAGCWTKRSRWIRPNAAAGLLP